MPLKYDWLRRTSQAAWSNDVRWRLAAMCSTKASYSGSGKGANQKQVAGTRGNNNPSSSSSPPAYQRSDPDRAPCPTHRSTPSGKTAACRQSRAHLENEGGDQRWKNTDPFTAKQASPCPFHRLSAGYRRGHRTQSGGESASGDPPRCLPPSTCPTCRLATESEPFLVGKQRLWKVVRGWFGN